jgi:L-arabinonolactonase
MVDVRVVVDARNTLGEGPIWCPRTETLYWVDNVDPGIWRYTPATGEARSWRMPAPIGSVVLRETGGMVAAMNGGFCFVDLDSKTIRQIAAPEEHLPLNRMNDGRCDRRGRYWCGSMNTDFTDRRPTNAAIRTAALYRLDPDLTCTRMDDGFIASNGIAFSPDDKTMYYADTTSLTVYAYDFDVDSGAISNRRVFISTEGLAGKVDGATVDADGFYWCAFVYDSAVRRYAPDGRLDRIITLPVKNPTCVAFGGRNLDVLYITSARQFLTADELAAQPAAGALLAVDLGVKGLPEPRFAG